MSDTETINRVLVRNDLNQLVYTQWHGDAPETAQFVAIDQGLYDDESNTVIAVPDVLANEFDNIVEAKSPGFPSTMLIQLQCEGAR